MTAIRIESKTILNFSCDQKINKHRITKVLRATTPIISISDNVIYDNDIIVGHYIIRLWNTFPTSNITHKKWSHFKFSIYERNRSGIENIINTKTDGRFKNQLEPKVNVKSLSNMIMHCTRLNNLKLFL